MKANGNELEHSNSKKSVLDISISAADINVDITRGMDMGMVEGEDSPPIAVVGSGGTSSQTDPHEQYPETEPERILMGELNKLIDQYNAEISSRLMICLLQKRPSSSSLTVTHKRRNVCCKI
mmetsp:Transcript_4432/g.6777  ORF Transcript_4432/g.6777 Transcript_4432/m.6777 type:complete len:122 (-) Transcript_4432:753-1118(-)